MFEFLLQFNVRLDIKNNQGLTPLSLAAKLARKEVLCFILMIIFIRFIIKCL